MKKLAALALLAALTLTACGDKDSDKDSSEKDTNEGTSQTTETTENETDAEETEESGDRPSVDEIVALIEKGNKASGMGMPSSLIQCMAKGLHDSKLSDEQVNNYLAADLDQETTDVMAGVASECAGL